MNWTPAQAAQLRKMGGPKPPRQPRTGYRSKVEAAFAQHLALQVKAGSIRSWKYEAVTLKLAPGVRYTPDFMVIGASGLVTFEEVKGRRGSGFWSKPVGKVKVRLAAEIFPAWDFYIVWPGAQPGRWESLRIGG